MEQEMSGVSRRRRGRNNLQGIGLTPDRYYVLSQCRPSVWPNSGLRLTGICHKPLASLFGKRVDGFPAVAQGAPESARDYPQIARGREEKYADFARGFAPSSISQICRVPSTAISVEVSRATPLLPSTCERYLLVSLSLCISV